MMEFGEITSTSVLEDLYLHDASLKKACPELLKDVIVPKYFSEDLMQRLPASLHWHEIDWSRNLVFTLFGAVYLGGVQYAMYVEGFKRLFPAMERFCNLSFRAKLKDREGQSKL